MMTKAKTTNSLLLPFITLLLSVCALLPQAAAHKYFFGLTEVSFNQRTERVEVIHQYTLHDVQRAMIEQYGKSFRIDEPKAEEKVKQWVENHFQLLNSNGEPVDTTWVGFEADFQNIWFYQEAKIERPDFCTWQVNNSLLMKVYPAQVNTVNFLSTGKTHGVALTADNSQQAVNCH